MEEATLISSEPLSLFYSYSHRDEDLRDELEKHLVLLQRTGLIRSWHDRRISPGAEWKGTIDRRLAIADIVLLLVSADFLASHYCFDVEMKMALQRHELGEATVIPVILRPVDWTDAPFAHLQALPRDGRAITLWSDRDQAFAEVARAIRGLITEFVNYRVAEAVEERFSVRPRAKPPRHVHIAHHTPTAPRLPDPPNAPSVEAFLRALVAGIGILVSPVKNDHGVLQCAVDLEQMRLRGFNEPTMLLCLWEPRHAPEHAFHLLTTHSPSSFGLLLCFTADAHTRVCELKHTSPVCVLSPAELAALAQQADRLTFLSQLVARQMGIRRVCPYETVHAVEGSMFFGRAEELRSLIEHDTTSFAIVGSSRIGKSSLLKRYRWLSLRHKLPRRSRLFLIDLYSCEPRAEPFFRHVAMAASPATSSTGCAARRWPNACWASTTPAD